ncbi:MULTISPECIES: DUF2818 family protein [Candidatus Ichthyocystis]|uniref:Putative membrane protein, DUF2818 family n=1 Tax=Candidatus Ichthyocystis hellenicum TaxID=1561003 RepID=A0A0S4M263_9BURK|nr:MULTISPECIES: DUF2818 family protein [Ichthyocystis]CUT17861.1 putative membrane protein, DUF2818 family [Candidatus Ichthyocystis hellenicum]
MELAYISIIFLATFLANLPFFLDSFLIFFRCRVKKLYLILIELFLFYLLVLMFSLLCEYRFSSIYHKNWVFYVVTLCGFAVLSYPGFVLRYLLKRKKYHEQDL